jgi:EpsI family protein
MSKLRALLAIALLAAAAALTHLGRGGRAVPNVELSAVPYAVGSWRGTDAPPLDPEVERTLAADAVLNRTYLAGGDTVGLYVAYYREQRPGVSVHSPLHCLPGTGWEPEATRTIDLGGTPDNELKQLVVRKNLNRAVVLYAYSVHGRLIADEIVSKLWLLHDRFRTGRGDAALFRVVVPVTDSVAAAERRGLAFTRDFLPFVVQLWS